jgi:hypothetical protein
MLEDIYEEPSKEDYQGAIDALSEKDRNLLGELKQQEMALGTVISQHYGMAKKVYGLLLKNQSTISDELRAKAKEILKESMRTIDLLNKGELGTIILEYERRNKTKKEEER